MVFPDATPAVLRDMLNAKSYLCFSVSAGGAIAVTGEDHAYLAQAHGHDADTSLVQGVLSLKDGALAIAFYGDSLRKTSVSQNDSQREAVEGGVRAALRAEFVHN